ncbi:LysR substrate-binding domain-containing protein [Vulcaniibacterium thermophilum]|jgi:DNA-binding transcriptional LysR family regulator|uniref:Transcriptional regulator n=1 Tax=Vulcaniibacterium thermophilum TaxID=1169913 RepID=A0A918YVH6_9GAMM|nr:LysR substrate-binding domain-containing protein [Vulcaniibacterium thermophilum]GHE25016.1 transcriptional regulator [Vulcaniibacterium thermophilum]
MGMRADWLSALAAFESAARHQNFAHAAEELHLTASAVSHQVRKLEARLGVTLFRRHARGVILTPAGRQLADTAGTALADLESVLASLRPGRDQRQRVRVTTLHSLAYTWLLPRLPQFARLHPDVRLDIETDVALTRFDDGGPDLGIRHGPGQWHGLAAVRLMDERLFPVASPQFPGLAAIATPAAIAASPLIADHARQGWHDWFRLADVHGARVEPRFTFTDSTDAMRAAAAGLGVALARGRIVQPYLDAGQLVKLPGPEMPGRWGYHIVYPAHRRLREPAQRFVDWLLSLDTQ